MNEDFVFETDEEGCGIVLDIPPVPTDEAEKLCGILNAAMENYDGVELLRREGNGLVHLSLKGDLSDVLALAEELREYFNR